MLFRSPSLLLFRQVCSPGQVSERRGERGGLQAQLPPSRFPRPNAGLLAGRRPTQRSHRGHHGPENALSLGLAYRVRFGSSSRLKSGQRVGCTDAANGWATLMGEVTGPSPRPLPGRQSPQPARPCAGLVTRGPPCGPTLGLPLGKAQPGSGTFFLCPSPLPQGPALCHLVLRADFGDPGWEVLGGPQWR